MGETAAAAVVVWLIALSSFDIRQRRLPNRLTLPGAAMILVAAAVTGHGAAAALGALTLSGVYAAVHLAAPASLGAGDVKLAIGLGALTGAFGPDVWVLAVIGSSLLTCAAVLCQLVRGGATSVPHGQSMCLAAGVSVAVVVI